MLVAERRNQGGFTLLEVLVALTVLVTVMAIVGAAMVTTINGWDRGQRALEGLRRGEHVMDQLANALRSTAGGGASTKQGIYGFQINNTDDNPPAGTMSWVTSSAAFLPPGSPLVYGLHRISLSIEALDQRQPALVVRSWPYLMTDQDQIDAVEPGFIAPEISGSACRVYDYTVQDWQTEWTSSNALPALVELTVYVNNDTNGDSTATAEPLVLQRIIEMPLGVTNVTDAMRITLNPFPPAGSGRKGGKGQKGKGGSGEGGRRGQGRGGEWGAHRGGQNAPGAGGRRGGNSGGLMPSGPRRGGRGGGQ